MIELQVGFPQGWLSKCDNFLAQMWLLTLYIYQKTFSNKFSEFSLYMLATVEITSLWKVSCEFNSHKKIF